MTSSVLSTITRTPTVTSTISTVVTVGTCSSAPNKLRRDAVAARSSSPSLPACVAGYDLAEISTACSCLFIPTPSTTVTSTSTVVPTSTVLTSETVTVTGVASTTVETAVSTVTISGCAAPTLCSNQGLQWAYYHNTAGSDQDSGYSTFDPAAYKDVIPVYENVTSSIGGIDQYYPTVESIYGSPPMSTAYFVLNHRGYIFAQQTGTYTFSFTQVDDVVFCWVGDYAFSGWAASNADIKVVDSSGNFTMDLTAGLYYPVRIVFGQAQGQALFVVSVKAPDGSTFLSSATDGSPYVVQFSCDGETAPPYAPFGSET